MFTYLLTFAIRFLTGYVPLICRNLPKTNRLKGVQIRYSNSKSGQRLLDGNFREQYYSHTRESSLLSSRSHVKAKVLGLQCIYVPILIEILWDLGLIMTYGRKFLSELCRLGPIRKNNVSLRNISVVEIM